MLVLIGILIIILLIIIIFYQNLIAEKIKVDDAQALLANHLKAEYNIDKENIEEKINTWSKQGMQLDAKSIQLFEYIAQVRTNYQIKASKFPYSVMVEFFKVRI